MLRQGAVEFDPLLPTDDITLLSTTVALVVRPDMQPALVSLLTYAVVHNPKSGFDKNGDPVLFYRAGEFPSGNDPEFEVANEARVVYKSGELPIVLKTLAPKAYSAGHPVLLYGLHQHALDDAGRHARRAGDPVAADAGAARPLCLDDPPAAGLLVPPAQGAGAQPRQRRRQYDAGALQAEFDRIDSAVRRIRVPLYYSDKLYDLRGHIDLVRQRLAVRPMPTRMAAE